jgi:hypothetical protein
VKLDDLTWNDMVLAIRRRIAANSDGKWTLHAAVDPGITLLELFAWLLEQRVYWMNQVPEALVRAALKLLGEEVRPAQSAATVLQFPARAFRIVSASTAMRLVKRQPSLIFSTDQALTLLPVERLGLSIGGRDRTADLDQGRTMRLFPADGSAAEVNIVLWLKEVVPTTASPFDATPNTAFALLFDLRTSTTLQPQWLRQATHDVAPPAPLTWWYRSGAKQSFAPFAQVQDGTGGLRRSGLVRLTLPSDWQPDGPAQDGLIPYTLRIQVDKATFTAPPRVERIIPNVVIARHLYQTREHSLELTWLPLPGNHIDLGELPKDEAEKDCPPLAAGMNLQLLERSPGLPELPPAWQEWTVVADLDFSGPGDRHVIVDRAQCLVRFGNGLTGRIPMLARLTAERAANGKVQYFVGGGSGGNLGDNLCWESVIDEALTARSAIDEVLTAHNVVPADGGKEPETIAEARERAASVLKQRSRAITREDYEALVLTTPGVAMKRAHVAVGFHPDHPCTKVPGAVTVFVVPDAPRETVDEAWVESAFVAAPVADPGALNAVGAQLETARLIASEVFVRNPRYRPVALTLTVEGDPADPMTMRERLKAHLQDFLDPLTGSDTRQGWPFGEPLRPSVLLRESQRALGDAGEVIAVAIKLLDTDAGAEECFDVSIGEHELVTLRDVNVQLRRSTQSRLTHGGLR